MASVEKREKAGKPIYVARWRDPEGKQRQKTFARKTDADTFAAAMKSDVDRGRYIDPDAGKVLFKTYATDWLAAQTFDESTRQATELRLRLHAFPVLGGLELRKVKPSTVQSWLRSIEHLAATYRRVIYANVSSVFGAAVDDELLARNPCRVSSVRRPQVQARKVVPWTREQVGGVHEALPERYRIVATLGAGLGLRQGEIFGLSPDDVDFLRGRVEVRRQVKRFVDGAAVFALPKGRKTRIVPLPDSVRDELAAYLATFRAVKVTLPWETKAGDPLTVPLVVTSRERKAMDRNYFNSKIWRPARDAAGIASARENGCHALRHFYASVLLDAGESIKAVSEYLGHADAGFTLRTYTHLMPSSDDRTRKAVDAALAACVPSVCEASR